MAGDVRRGWACLSSGRWASLNGKHTAKRIARRRWILLDAAGRELARIASIDAAIDAARNQ